MSLQNRLKKIEKLIDPPIDPLAELSIVHIICTETTPTIIYAITPEHPAPGILLDDFLKKHKLKELPKSFYEDIQIGVYLPEPDDPDSEYV